MRLNFLVSSSGIRKGGPLGFLSVCARNKNNLVGSVCLVLGCGVLDRKLEKFE